MELVAINQFGTVVSDERVPENEIWIYSHGPIEVEFLGQKQLAIPHAKITNIGREKSGLARVIAPPG